MPHVASRSDWLRNVLAWAARRLFGDDTLARVMLASRPCSMPEFTQWVRRRDAYRRVFHEQVTIRLIPGRGVRSRRPPGMGQVRV